MTKKKDPADYVDTGRPSKYKPEYCKKAVELGRIGKFPSQIASAFEVHLNTLHEWCNVHPEFLEAYDIAKQASKDYMLDLATKRAEGENRFGSDIMIKFLLSAGHGMREKSDLVSTNVHKVAVADWGDEPESTDQ